MMTRVYILLALVAGLGAFWWHYEGVVQDRDAYKLQAKTKSDELDVANRTITAERLATAQAMARAASYQTAVGDIQHESDTFRACVASGKCGVQWRYQVCAAGVPGADADQPGVNAEAKHRADTNEWAINLLEAVRLDAAQIAALQEDLTARADTSYCKPLQ